MSKNITEIPLTEGIERVMDITRASENARYRVKAAMNDVYTKELPFKWDWNFLFASSSIITEKEYTTGSVSVNTGETALVFSSDVSLDASYTGKQIKISGNDTVYDFTYSNATGGTITPSFQGPSNASSNAYSLYQGKYSLASNFDRFPKDGGVYKWIGGKKEIIKEESFQEESRYFAGNPTASPERIRLVETDTLGRQMIRFRPAPNSAKVYGYDYIKKVTPLSESTAGTVTISSASTTVTGTSSAFTDMSAGDYLRVDALGTRDDSTWYRIASITNSSSLTLASVFANTAVTTASYTISKAPDMPVKMHPCLIYGAIRSIIVDQNDPNLAIYLQKYQETIVDAKRLYVSRVYSQPVQLIAEEFMYRR